MRHAVLSLEQNVLRAMDAMHVVPRWLPSRPFRDGRARANQSLPKMGLQVIHGVDRSTSNNILIIGTWSGRYGDGTGVVSSA